MKEIISFLEQLSENNNKTWFDAHKADYTRVRAEFEAFVTRIIEGIRKFDDSIGPLAVKDCTYRIYRDVRFSKNKEPYKCHFGAFIAPGGKKAGNCGYYFQISASKSSGWEGSHMVAIGDYMCDPKVVKVLREDIEYGGDEFDRVVRSADPRLAIDSGQSLKKVPAGFPADSPNAEYLKLKNFCLTYAPDTRKVLSKSFEKDLLAMFESAMPFKDYVNRAIAYVREEQ